MGSNEVGAKFKETLKSARELAKAIKEATHEQLVKSAPKVVNSLDRSIDEASKTLSEFMGSLDRRTSKEQLELLKAYRSFLRKQSEVVEGRLAALEREFSAKEPEGTAQNAG